jgi:hypothetical protein
MISHLILLDCILCISAQMGRCIWNPTYKETHCGVLCCLRLLCNRAEVQAFLMLCVAISAPPWIRSLLKGSSDILCFLHLSPRSLPLALLCSDYWGWSYWGKTVLPWKPHPWVKRPVSPPSLDSMKPWNNACKLCVAHWLGVATGSAEDCRSKQAIILLVSISHCVFQEQTVHNRNR